MVTTCVAMETKTWVRQQKNPKDRIFCVWCLSMTPGVSSWTAVHTALSSVRTPQTFLPTVLFGCQCEANRAVMWMGLGGWGDHGVS